jgi:homocitrate synthase NifV
MSNVEMPLMIEDSTLREGEQSPGVVFSVDEKVEIARLLADVGVDAIEVGTPAMGGPELEAIERLVNEDLNLLLIGWNRGRRSDLEASLRCGLRAVHIGLPASDHHLEKKFGKSREWVVETMAELVDFAKGEGAWVSVSAEDSGRADVEFLVDYAKAVGEAGADRLRMSDTIGVLEPFGARDLFARVTAAAQIPVQAHMHNDFGLATANTLAAVSGGARQIHATVNGLGERAGIASLDEVLMGLERHLGIDHGCRLDALLPLAEFVARASGRPIPANKPIVGRSIFEHESGIHVDGVLKVPDAFEPFTPETVGAERRIVIGKHSGSSAIQYVLAQAGIEVSREKLADVTTAVRYEATRVKRPLAPAETVRVYQSVVGADV